MAGAYNTPCGHCRSWGLNRHRSTWHKASPLGPRLCILQTAAPVLLSCLSLPQLCNSQPAGPRPCPAPWSPALRFCSHPTPLALCAYLGPHNNYSLLSHPALAVVNPRLPHAAPPALRLHVLEAFEVQDEAGRHGAQQHALLGLLRRGPGGGDRGRDTVGGAGAFTSWVGVVGAGRGEGPVVAPELITPSTAPSTEHRPQGPRAAGCGGPAVLVVRGTRRGTRRQRLLPPGSMVRP